MNSLGRGRTKRPDGGNIRWRREGGAGEARAPQGQLAATTTSLEAAARLAVFEPGDRQTSLITRYRLRVPFKCTRRTKRVRVPYQYVAELVFRARGAVTIYLSRACLVDFPHRMRGREEERDGANDSLHVGRPARKLVERRRGRLGASTARPWCVLLRNVAARRPRALSPNSNRRHVPILAL